MIAAVSVSLVAKSALQLQEDSDALGRVADLLVSEGSIMEPVIEQVCEAADQLHELADELIEVIARAIMASVEAEGNREAAAIMAELKEAA